MKPITTYEGKVRVKQRKKQYHAKVRTTNIKIVNPKGHYPPLQITVYIPKLSPKYKEPTVIVHCTGTLCATNSPQKIAEEFRRLADTITSDPWLNDWEHLLYLAEKILNNEDTIIDEKFMVAVLWKMLMINSENVKNAEVLN